jgi:diadenosine tetraphosphate (Ap4A) HIT family hydrolase
VSAAQSQPETPPNLPLSGEALSFPPDKGGLRGASGLTTCELCTQDGGEVIFKNDFLRVVLVDDPDYPGFCRVICNAHIREMTDLPIAQRSQLMQTVCKVEQVLREVMQPDKINLASLGNLTPHLHWHVIPRYQNDKHFPQPIWGVTQRESRTSLDSAWRGTLLAALHATLITLPSMP